MQIIRDEANLSNYLLGPCRSLARTSRRLTPNDKTAKSTRFWTTNPLLFDSYYQRHRSMSTACATG